MKRYAGLLTVALSFFILSCSHKKAEKTAIPEEVRSTIIQYIKANKSISTEKMKIEFLPISKEGDIMVVDGSFSLNEGPPISIIYRYTLKRVDGRYIVLSSSPIQGSEGHGAKPSSNPSDNPHPEQNKNDKKG